ncbi:MAG: trypsin-like peptidase domain-containing protein, partial [Tepidisphaeraceae bacterium]
DEQDIAIIKIKVDKPVPYIKLAAYDQPKVGADVSVMGFPLLSVFGLNSTVKMTRGIVTAYDHDRAKCDVTVDAQVNPGNSGGPMVDRFGHLLALTAMKTLALDSSISSYGLGISTGRVRQFIEKQQATHFPDLKLERGAAEGPGLSSEELADKITPATVCILMVHGEDPTASEADKVPTTQKSPKP